MKAVVKSWKQQGEIKQQEDKTLSQIVSIDLYLHNSKDEVVNTISDSYVVTNLPSTGADYEKLYSLCDEAILSYVENKYNL